jgi:hypothetical protein
MADLVNAYGSLPLEVAEDTVVAIAERLGLTDVATLDRRHFTWSGRARGCADPSALKSETTVLFAVA